MIKKIENHNTVVDKKMLKRLKEAYDLEAQSLNKQSSQERLQYLSNSKNEPTRNYEPLSEIS